MFIYSYFQDHENPENPTRYLKWSHGFIVVYSITSRSTFDVAHGYLEAIGQYQRENDTSAPVILVGNKMDLERYRWIDTHTNQKLIFLYLFTDLFRNNFLYVF